jgi:uracil-DNA glycosylase family 4
MPNPTEPPRDCPLCPRLVAYREANRAANPDWFNGPAPSFGDPNARLLIAGLAPGRTGANRTGRPFTGDHAGWLLYETLGKLGYAKGVYRADPDDGVTLHDCMITNAVRCGPFLQATLASLTNLKVIVTLGDVSRRNVLRALGLKASAGVSGHASEFQAGPYTVINSYHCSRLNTNTGRLTPAMFEAVFQRARDLIAA